MKDTYGIIDTRTADDFSAADNMNNHKTKADDKYTHSIDLSNACREFYQTRKKAAEVVKEKLANSGRHRSSKKKTSIDVAMETLTNEMSSLMDQDLSLMKQLLTLNETIEDLKWQKKYYHNQSSVPGSSCDLSASDCSVSETDMYESENEALQKYQTSSPVSVSGLQSKRKLCTEIHDLETNSLENSETDLYRRPLIDTASLTNELELFLAGKGCHEEQSSFDSGIHDTIVREQIAA